MIDFMSTRDSTEVQARRCAQLLTAVIGHAIKDAAMIPLQSERKHKQNRRLPHAAIKFLFEPEGVFEVYAQLIGMTAEEIRAALLSKRPLNPKQKNIFSEEERRIIQVRYIWHKGNPVPLDKKLDVTFYEDEEYEE